MKSENVLLTGATGAFGKYLLEQLLATNHQIIVLVRAKDSAAAKLRLANYVKSKQKLSQIKVLSADLEITNLGLSNSEYKELQQSVTAIIHAAASYKDGVKFQQKHQNRNDAPTGRLAIVGNYLKFTGQNGQELLNLDINNIKRLAEANLELIVWDQTTDYAFYFPGWGQALASTQFGLIGLLNSTRLQNKSEVQQFIRTIKAINPSIRTWNLSVKNSIIIGFIITFLIIAIALAVHYL